MTNDVTALGVKFHTVAEMAAVHRADDFQARRVALVYAKLALG